MKKCSYCGRENEEEAVACSECGKEFESMEFEAMPLSETDPELLDAALSPVIVGRFSSLQEASLLAGRLEAAGIEASIPEEYSEQVFSAVIGLERLTVRVAAKDYEAAMAVVAEGAETPPATAAPAGSEASETTDAGSQAAGELEAEAEGSPGRKPCVSCRAAIPYEATVCPKCGWTQPPLS